MNEVDMTPVVSKEYECAVEEAANAFMKVMALRGFNVRDYPQNFVAQMAQSTRLDFEVSRTGPHANADALVSDVLSTAPFVPKLVPVPKEKKQAFAALRRRMA